MSNAVPANAPSRLIQLSNDWHELAQSRPPQSSGLPFDALVASHPGLGLLEPAGAEGEQDFLVVQIGPEHEARTCRDITGMLASKVLPPSIAPWVLKVYRETMQAQRPRYLEILSCVYGLEPLDCCRLIVPLFDDRGNPTHLLDSWVWHDEPDQALL
ncbi:MAG: hypothetical protein GY948_05640 [Alphaproteobacteria bacterium]|nr:hypothetical protein [Alphaproteobacteria bacterium]